MNQTPLLAAALLTTLSIARADLGVKRIATGFERPVWAGVPLGAEGKLWVMEQSGKVWIVDKETGKRGSKPFLDISADITTEGGEEGLLGFAFSPDFSDSGRFYVNYTDKEEQTCIARFTSADRKTTHSATSEVIMKYPSEFKNHNGGWIAFGPDQMLYIGNGDGGAGDDPNKRGQALDTLLGKILRVDVSTDRGYKIPLDNPFVNRVNAKPEIWAYGVRNPWRCSFDRKTGDFWLGDVGQNHWEEINYLPAGSKSGANFGWRLREADKANPKKDVGGPSPINSIDPIYVYNHGMKDHEGFSVTGGYVYRGPIQSLQGRYIFGDYQNPRVWSFKLKNGKAIDLKDHTKELQPEGDRINLISSFAEDNSGDLFIIDHTGSVYQIINQ